MKVVNYRGMTFEIGDYFQYIATDVDGSIFAYERKPFDGEDEWFNSDGGDVKRLKEAGESWRESLENC